MFFGFDRRSLERVCPDPHLGDQLRCIRNAIL
jgi:hypothetical protein